MKQTEDCASIHDIRSCIDEIDGQIIDSIGRRQQYVLAASRFKSSVAEVRAEDRVKSMLAQRRAWAVEKGCDPDFIEALFRMTVDHFVGKEIKHWENRAPQNTVNATDITIGEATVADARDILALQKRAFLQEAEKLGDNYNITPITERLPRMLDAFKTCRVLKAVNGSFLVGSIRAQVKNETCFIYRLIVEPVFQRRGYGRALLDAIENLHPGVRRFELFTGRQSADNIGFYSKAGYRITREYTNPEGIQMVTMAKDQDIQDSQDSKEGYAP
jgi:isochorismate pyruvate lyase